MEGRDDMAKGDANEILFVVGVFIFLGVFFTLGGMINADINRNTLGHSSTSAPPTPPEDILGTIPYLISMMGYLITSVFGMSSEYAFISGIIIVPIMVGFAYLIMKLIRGS